MNELTWGGGVLNFSFLICVCGPKGKKKKTSAKFGVLTDFLSNLRLLKLKLDLMLGIRTELFFNFEPLKCKFSRNLWFQANVGSWGTKKFWNGGFREGSGGRERGVLRIFTLFLISQNVAVLLWLVMLVVGLIDIQYMQSVIKGSMKLSHGYFEYSWSDVMGILDVQKLTSSVNIHEMNSWVLNIQKLTSWTFWIFMRWHHWHFEYEVTLWNYSEADAMGILNIHSDIVILNNQNYGVFWIFIVMTSLQEYSKYQCHYEYSKYPWRQLLIFTWRHFVSIQNTHNVTSCILKIPMTSAWILNYRWPHLMNTQITHEVTSWVFKRPITSLHEFSKYPWRQHSNIQINHEVTSFMVTLVFWILFKKIYSKKV